MVDAFKISLVEETLQEMIRRFYERVESNRNFNNKLWNASRFVLAELK